MIENDRELNDFLTTAYRKDLRYVAESAVDFNKELSVIICRNAGGEMAVFPVAENIHRNQILFESIIPARVDDAVLAEVNSMALHIAEGLQLAGTLALELFLCDNEILVNELAPRPHNSGHFTLNACFTSQFEQHVRAICNLPLGDVGLTSPCVMRNILGEHMASLNREKIGKHKIHLYGKSESRKGRKMGHINILDKEIDTCLQIAETIL